jgi:hypothetical protein
VDVGAIPLDRDAVLRGRVRDEERKGEAGLTSPQVTTQFLMTMSWEFQLSKPSVLTVLYWEEDVAFMSRLVIVMFDEYATKVCL